MGMKVSWVSSSSERKGVGGTWIERFIFNYSLHVAFMSLPAQKKKLLDFFFVSTHLKGQKFESRSMEIGGRRETLRSRLEVEETRRAKSMKINSSRNSPFAPFIFKRMLDEAKANFCASIFSINYQQFNES
jgi:hypothetical protein